MPFAEVTCLNGIDICNLLDAHPNLRRSYPEILGLQDLNALLLTTVNKQVLERSRAAIEETRDLVPVFVPTMAYDKAWRTLQRHSFVVLDGPPEMGKTAIARTIALSRLLMGWQIIDCRNPEDFFAAFDSSSRQLFVADDAFGRTEYDPELGRMWERDLPRILNYIDPRHNLVWTTRKHILARALHDMDLTGRAAAFPKPSEVIVTADDLTVEEKARILYRHGRAARLDTPSRAVVRDNAVRIVADVHFTPERIRRFVAEVLPNLTSKPGAATLTEAQVTTQVQEAIRNPTDRMRKAFRKLPEYHRWILIALLECEGAAQSDALRTRFLAQRAAASSVVFAESLHDLLGTFVKIGAGLRSWESPKINWIHPSYRDLVIDELASNNDDQLAFLKRVSPTGVKLALSVAGGSAGERQMPLVSAPEAWPTLETRCREIASGEDDRTVAALLDVLSSALTSEPRGVDTWISRMTQILVQALEIAARRWDERDEAIDLAILWSFNRAANTAAIPVRRPAITATWEAVSNALRDDIRKGFFLSEFPVWVYADLTHLVETHYPDLARASEYLSVRSELETRLLEIADDVAGSGTALGDPEANEDEGRRIQGLANALLQLDKDGEREQLVSALSEIADEYRANGRHDDDPEYEPDDDSPSSVFDVPALFADF